MSDTSITPIILCGGSGTRLWPLSRKTYPKQFAPLLGQGSLFQASARRLSDHLFQDPVVITAADFRFIVAEQLLEAGIDQASIVLEPTPRNTAPAILAAVLAADLSEEQLVLCAPSDHVIPDGDAFRRTIAAGCDAAQAGQIVTFGITPTRPETGYGWLELESVPGPEGPIPLKNFVEKPSIEDAERMFDEDTFLWNAGLFLMSVQGLIAAFEAHCPDLLAATRAAVASKTSDLDFVRLDPDAWEKIDSISIDYAIMERSANLSVVPYSGTWSDLGGWDAVWRASPKDALGVSAGPNTSAINCENTLLRSESSGQELVGLGLQNIMAVSMNDAVLVADMSSAQDVRLAVSALKSKNAKQAEVFPRDYRPWGWFEALAHGDRFQVKRITVKPGGVLSMQSHVHRAEHWVVVQGTARVTVGDDVRLVAENEAVFIPLGAKHRLENPGKLPMVLIEIQTGSYLDEDDITRFEDIYSRD